MMKTTLLFAGCFLLCGHFSYAQSVYEACGLPKSAYSNFYTVDVEQARCLARHSDKAKTLFYTYADWCTHCKAALPDVVALARQHNADLYLLLVDEENQTYYSINRTAAMLDTVYHNTLKAVLITDSLYSPKALKKLRAPIRKIIDIRGKSAREKYYYFLSVVAPDDEEENRLTGMGKLIVMDKWGEVLGVITRDFDNLDSPYKGYDKVVELLK